MSPETGPKETILVLGGTAEAVALARRIASERPTARLVVSLAGRTRAPSVPDGEVRIGGFGGASGLAAYLVAEGVTRLVDATHPFAVGMSRNAAAAAELSRTPRIALVRPAWRPVTGDRWTDVACLGAARDALTEGARPLLALGRQHVAPFARRSDLRPVLRMVDPPEEPLPFAAELVIGKPSADWREEASLFTRLALTHLVCRNSGGSIAYAKIEAARRLSIPVIMIGRAAEAPPPSVPDVEAVMIWLDA